MASGLARDAPVALTCNIDRRGRRIRLRFGIALLLAAMAYVFFTWPPASWEWTLGLIGACVGSFIVFEARVGWCVVRAMGLRTPI